MAGWLKLRISKRALKGDLWVSLGGEGWRTADELAEMVKEEVRFNRAMVTNTSAAQTAFEQWFTAVV